MWCLLPTIKYSSCYQSLMLPLLVVTLSDRGCWFDLAILPTHKPTWLKDSLILCCIILPPYVTKPSCQIRAWGQVWNFWRKVLKQKKFCISYFQFHENMRCRTVKHFILNLKINKFQQLVVFQHQNLKFNWTHHWRWQEVQLVEKWISGVFKTEQSRRPKKRKRKGTHGHIVTPTFVRFFFLLQDPDDSL